jgi:cytochrome P450
MKTFTTFDQPSGWPSIGAAFQADLAAGHRIQTTPWGGLAILGHAELSALARNPVADGMPPDAAAMAETPAIYNLLMRSVFTKSGPAHRADRAALIAALNTVDIPALARAAVATLPERAECVDLKAEFIAPLVRSVWASVVGYDPQAAQALERAVADMSHILSTTPDSSKAALAETAALEARSLSLAALANGAPFAEALQAAVGAENAADLIAGMVFDAIETSTTGLAASLRIAAQNRQVLAATRQCANELLRLASPAPMTMRLTTAPIRLGETEIEAGTALFMVWAAGNHDPLAFPRPERLDPARQDARPLMFGMGQHACLGHAIVRTTLQELLAFFLRKQPQVTGDSGGWNIFQPADMPPLKIGW